MARQLAFGPGCSLKDFCSHHSDCFNKTSDHISVHNWLNDIEEVLSTTRCTEEQKVVYTSYRLTGKAKCWLQTKKALLTVELGLEIVIT